MTDTEVITHGVDKLNVSGDHDDANHRDGGRRHRQSNNDEPIMVKRGESGTVKWFSFKSGYGFIAINNTDQEVFVHSSAIVTLRKVFCVLREGDEVEFDVIQGIKGLEAIAVTGVGGKRTGGVRFADRRPPPNRGDIEGKKGGGGGGRRRRNTSQGSTDKNENEKNSGGAVGEEAGNGGSNSRRKQNGRPRKSRGGKRTSGGSGSEKFVDAKAEADGGIKAEPQN